MVGARSSKILSVKDQIAEQIRSDIISGELLPNTKLNEKELADRFGLSRGPIRDVILQLTKEGLLISKNNCGASVNSVLDPKLQKLMIKLRREVEIFAIDQLRDKLTENDFKELEDILEQLQTAFENKDFTEATKIDISFHSFLIYKAGGDELVNIWYPYVMRMCLKNERHAIPEQNVNEHKMIIEALKSSDSVNATKYIKAKIK